MLGHVFLKHDALRHVVSLQTDVSARADYAADGELCGARHAETGVALADECCLADPCHSEARRLTELADRRQVAWREVVPALMTEVCAMDRHLHTQLEPS